MHLGSLEQPPYAATGVAAQWQALMLSAVVKECQNWFVTAPR